jgi:hypothetical protein
VLAGKVSWPCNCLSMAPKWEVRGRSLTSYYTVKSGHGSLVTHDIETQSWLGSCHHQMRGPMLPPVYLCNRLTCCRRRARAKAKLAPYAT